MILLSYNSCIKILYKTKEHKKAGVFDEAWLLLSVCNEELDHCSLMDLKQFYAAFASKRPNC